MVGLAQHRRRGRSHLALCCLSRRQIRFRQHAFHRDVLALPGFVDMVQMLFQIVPGNAHQRMDTFNSACHIGVMQQVFAFQFNFRLSGSLARLVHEACRLQGELLGNIPQPPALVDDAGNIHDAVECLADQIQIAGGERHQQQEHRPQLDADRQTPGQGNESG